MTPTLQTPAVRDVTVLIVDDSATTRAVIKRTIRLSGAATSELLEAGDGAAALKVLHDRLSAGRGPVDLVLTDLNMPVMDGYELVRRILETPALANIPMVVISAQPDADRAEMLKVQGVRRYLPKPFTPESVRDLFAAA